jgi:hypothetical protein
LTPDRIEQAFFSDRDIVLTEGFKKGDKPKIVVLTQGKEEQLLQEIEGGVLATVGENPVRANCPHFSYNDFEGLVNMLEDRFLKSRKRPSLRVTLDGENIPLNHFVQDVISSGLTGMLSPLKGFKESGKIEIKIHKPKKDSL